MSVQEMRKGTVVYRTGDPADCMYHIRWGKVNLVGRNKASGRMATTELFAGDLFGERGLIDGEARCETATVAERDTVIERIGRDEFGRFLSDNPRKVYELFQRLSHELREVTQDYLGVCQSVADAMSTTSDAGAEGTLAHDPALRQIHDRNAQGA